MQGQPTLNGITIGENSYSDWGTLSALTSYPMWEAGASLKPNGDPKPVVSTAYKFVDCQKQELCVLVLMNPGYYLGNDITEMWIKDYNGPRGNANIEGNKAFITDSAGSRIGWEGCFSLSHFNQQDSQIQIHGGFDTDADGGSRTTSTGKNEDPKIKINFACDRTTTTDSCPTDSVKTSPGLCGCGVPDIDTDMDGTPNCFDNCSLDANKTSPGLCGCGVSDRDTDMDGTPDCRDECTMDANKTLAGLCGCGIPDTDSDGDRTPDCRDNCTLDASKTLPGVCGCGISDVDTDRDGVPNCNDPCVNNPDKTLPGVCGCNQSDVDRDGDSVPDCIDGCPDDRYKTIPGLCGCGRSETGDRDGDGTHDCQDGCPDDRDKTSEGVCGCGKPDVDSDRDGVLDCDDVCPYDPNKKYVEGPCGCNVSDVDTDGGGTPDCHDLCPYDKNKVEPGVCNCSVPDRDTDGDGLMDCLDGCPADGLKNASGVCGCGIPDVDMNRNGVVDCKEVVTFTTCSFTGDPHITTCDGMYYSCQGQGEFVMMKQGGREIQARFIHFDPPRLWSVTRGIAVQDEGATPKVQITEPQTSSQFYTMPRYVGKHAQYFDISVVDLSNKLSISFHLTLNNNPTIQTQWMQPSALRGWAIPRSQYWIWFFPRDRSDVRKYYYYSLHAVSVPSFAGYVRFPWSMHPQRYRYRPGHSSSSSSNRQIIGFH